MPRTCTFAPQRPRAALRKGEKGHRCLLRKSGSTSPPHVAHDCRDIDARRAPNQRLVARAFGPGAALEQLKQVVGNEPRSWREHVAVAVAMLLRAEEAQRLHQM